MVRSLYNLVKKVKEIYLGILPREEKFKNSIRKNSKVRKSYKSGSK